MPTNGKAAKSTAAVKGKVTIKSSGSRNGAVQSRPGPSSNVSGGKRKKARRNEDMSDDEGEQDSSADEGSDAYEDDQEADTDEEIANAQAAGKSKKTAKRKRRATSPNTFGETLEQLLGNAENASYEDDGQENQEMTQSQISGRQQPAILSLAPHIRRGAQSSRLNAKAARLALAARKKREDRAHVSDVIAGWGKPGELPKTEEGDEKVLPVSSEGQEMEEAEKLKGWLDEGGAQGYEKRLRKAAQRGVVKLFNAIRAAQNTSAEDLEEEDEGKETSSRSTHTSSSKPPPTGKKADNPLGGKAKAVNELSKNNFFDMLRAGTKTKAGA